MTTKTVYSISYDDWHSSAETQQEALYYGDGDETSIYKGTAKTVEWEAVFTKKDMEDFKETLSESLYEIMGDVAFNDAQLDEDAMRAVILNEIKRQKPDTGYYLVDDIVEVDIDVQM